MSMGAPLYALIAAIKRSPIVVRLGERLLLAPTGRAYASRRMLTPMSLPGSQATSGDRGARRARSCEFSLLQFDPRDYRAAPVRLASPGCNEPWRDHLKSNIQVL
jgi:hypothetical protein